MTRDFIHGSAPCSAS